jgi:hypothetical protein
MHGQTRESLEMRRAYGYVEMTEDEVQRSRWTFCEVVNIKKASFNHQVNL